MIKNIKLGIKIATRNFDLLPYIYSNKDIIDFIEIILMPEFTYEDIETIKNLKLSYALHLPNLFYGIDFGDISKNEKNLEYIKKVNLYSNHLNPICVIAHPETSNIDLSIANLKKLKLKPLAIENMPIKSLVEAKLLGFDIPSIKKYFDEIPDLKFCLDLNHAIKAAISKKLNYITFIEDFINFKEPLIFHISGGHLDREIDEHLAFNNSEYNLREIKELLFTFQKTVYLTFETPRDYEKIIDNDLDNMEIFLKC